MIETFYNATYTQLRKATATPTSTDGITTVSTFLGVRRPIDDVSKLYIETNIGKEHNIYCDDSNSVSVGDELIENGSVTYEVLGVSDYDDLEDDTDSHLLIRVSA